MPKVYQPMQGLKIWRNDKNKFVIFELHYTADPTKRSDEFKNTVKSSMPHRDYMREYELHWDSFEGLPVFQDWNTQVHGSVDNFYAKPGLPLIRGWDFGLTPACVICQLRDDKLIVLKEIVHFNKGVDKFYDDNVLPVCRLTWPEWSDPRKDWIDVIDPAGFGRAQTDENTCARVLASKGLNPMSGAIIWEERRQSVDEYLTRFTKGEPCFRVNLSECPVLVKGFEGGYRYAEKAIDHDINRVKPIKDEHSHVQDALQMVTSWVKRNNKRRRSSPIPGFYYGFTKS